MKNFGWNKSMELGVVEIDIQHRIIVNIINMLEDTIEMKTYKSQFNFMITEIEKFLLYHFATEEKLFNEYEYESSDHIASHSDILEKIIAYKRVRPSEKYVREVISELKNHVHEHSLTIDKIFTDFMLAKIAARN